MSPRGRTIGMKRKPPNNRTQSIKSAKQSRQGGDLEKTLALIRARPGIRPSEINRLLNREESDALRSARHAHQAQTHTQGEGWFGDAILSRLTGSPALLSTGSRDEPRPRSVRTRRSALDINAGLLYRQ
jgi:hypothetical protein